MASINNSSTQLPDHDSQHSRPGSPPPPAQSYSIKDRFNQLSSQKQFALISLIALGTSMLITGRSVRAIMKRANAKTAEIPESEMMIKSIGKEGTGMTNSGEKKLWKQEAGMKKNKIDKIKFWDNQSLLCLKEKKIEGDMEMNFNPASDALGAFGIATILVITTSTLTIKFLSHRWELDNFDDWRIFIQSGYLAKQFIPENFADSMSDSIPNKLRTSAPEHQLEDPSLSNSSDPSHSLLDEFIDTFDNEWKIEKNRREIERIHWENHRKLIGKRNFA